MMIPRRKIEILLALLVLIVLGVLLWWLFHKAVVPTQDTNTQTTKTLPQQTTTQTTGDAQTTTTIKQNLPPTAQTIARSFVERFGSFSNESEYKNIQDVMSMATPRLQTDLKKLAEDAKKATNTAYYGISTTVISLKATNTTDTQVDLTISTRRSESIESPANTTTRSQDIKVTLVKDGENWLVDAYTWQ